MAMPKNELGKTDKPRYHVVASLPRGRVTRTQSKIHDGERFS